MLSREDRLLAERDAKVPGMAVVLDPEALAEEINEGLAAGPRVEPGEALYVRYKPGTSCLCLHRMRVPGGSLLLHAVAFSAGSVSKLEKESTRSWSEGTLGSGMLNLGLGVQVAVFPNDRRLRSLHRLEDDHRLRRLLQRLAREPEPEGAAHVKLTTLSYKPQRRFVARVDRDDAVAGVLKLYTRHGFDRSGLGLRQGGHEGGLRLPRQLGRSRRHGARLWEWIPGRSVADLLSEGASVAWLREVGRALAQLHALAPVTGSRARSAALEMAEYGRASAALIAVVPASRPRVTSVQERLLRHDRSGGRAVQLHGDFYAKQVVVEEGAAPAVIDLDSSCVGEAEFDVGNFLAHLEADALRGRLPAERVPVAGEAFLEGYLSAGGGLATHRLRSAVAGALLRLAPQPFRRRDPSWPEKTDRLLQRAEEHLESPRWIRMGNVA